MKHLRLGVQDQPCQNGETPVFTKHTKINQVWCGVVWCGVAWCGVVAGACNTSTLGGQGRCITRSRNQDHPGQHGETPSLLKIQKISAVIPATQEAEAGELPEPRRWRLR